jgi:protein SCO1/2
MLRTALAAALLACAGYAGASWLTHDFQVWTAEGARRLEVALQPVPVPRCPSKGRAFRAAPAHWLLAQGAVTVVDFIYTRCETVCLSWAAVFQQLQRRPAGAHGAGRGGAPAVHQL